MAEEIKETKETQPDDKVIEIKESEFNKLKQETAESKDKYVRLFAEFDNARKRMEREKLEFVKYANEELIVDLLQIVDSLEQSLKSTGADKDSLMKGIELVVKQFQDILKKNGVTPIDTKGQMFDHNLHEVLMQEESDQFNDGAIIEEFQKGYTLEGKVIRTAKVKIAKRK